MHSYDMFLWVAFPGLPSRLSRLVCLGAGGPINLGGLPIHLRSTNQHCCGFLHHYSITE